MILFGLHIVDWVVIFLYLAGMVWIGWATASSVHGQSDFFLAGRKLGGIFQFFLNFGNMTEATGAVKTSSLVFSQGVGGVWLSLQTLFMTPYYWFMNAWFRRVRLTTVADLFTDRFGSRTLAVIYAVSNIAFNIVAIGGTYLVTYKMTEVIVVKPASAYSPEEAARVRAFREFSELNSAYRQGKLEPQLGARYAFLRKQHESGAIKSYVSYVRPVPLYITFALVVAVYVILGGMTAAAITDALQGLLIVVFSLILIPFGLWKLGGIREFHNRLPDYMLDLFGSGAGSEFAWYSVIAILLVTIVQIHASVGNMSIAGSAKDERAASLGAVTGGFMKRWMIIAWCFCGLIAYALFGGRGLSDPDAVWGTLSNTLLGPGFLGLMLVGILAADMAHLSAQSLALSALFVRNVYVVVFPTKTEQQGLTMGRILIAGALLLGIVVALAAKDILSFMKMALTLNVAFGAAVLVIFKWRRVTQTAVFVSVVLSLLAIVFIPLAVPAIPALNTLPALQALTREQREIRTRKATRADVAAGRAREAGELLETVKITAPRPIFFERLVAIHPAEPDSQLRGEGRFQLELFLLSLAGLDLANMRPAQLLALMYCFDAIFPFIWLFGVSLTTRDKDVAGADRFYAKMRTPVVPDPETDRSNLARSLSQPQSTEKAKLFPGSSWELMRWKRSDFVAFTACCAFAVFILGAFFFLLQFGRN